MNYDKIFIELKDALSYHNENLSEKKRRITPDFNAFEILYAKELSLSRMIGEFLNPKGTHEQGRVFLELFINMFLKNNSSLKKSGNIKIELEHSVPKGRIDIFLDFNNKFGIAIENKPYAYDLDEQIITYCNYLEKRYGSINYLMIYLSSDGSEPAENSLTKAEKDRLGKQFINISYSQIKEWLLICVKHTEKVPAERLTVLIREFSEYINKQFCGTNSLKDKMIGESIKQNILEAYEINLLWKASKDELEAEWKKTINNLVNKVLPKLIFVKLKNDGIVNDDWEYHEGKFDIEKLHLEGFRFKKKSWKYFELAVISDRFKTANGTRNFFPAIISKKQINRQDYNEFYCQETGTDFCKHPFLIKPSTQWYANFKDNYRNWGYEQWSEIKPDGKTVEYVADILGKLIKASEKDIDEIENSDEK